MTEMLASVADAAEAEVALQCGADIIDLKDPRRGALGAVEIDVAALALAAVARRRPVSATLGDPPYEASALLDRARALIGIGVDYLKLAVDAESLARLGAALGALRDETALIGMLFADEAPDFGLITHLQALGFKGAMLDTRVKSRGRLLRYFDVVRLEEFCRRCREAGLTSGLAGSLEPPDIPRLLLARPDVLGFRGALTRRHAREQAIDPQAARLVRDLIPRQQPEASDAANVDWRRLARGFVGEPEAQIEVDRVFVRDFLVEAHVGAYDFERGAPQRVMFDVEASVRRPPPNAAADMSAIFSYDVILDAIRLIVGRRHCDFVETLAEEAAAAVLARPRVVRVRVNVRKLDVINGAVGVEIVRERPTAASEARPFSALARGPGE